MVSYQSILTLKLGSIEQKKLHVIFPIHSNESFNNVI